MDPKTETAELAVIDLGVASVETQGGPGHAIENGQSLGMEGISEE